MTEEPVLKGDEPVITRQWLNLMAEVIRAKRWGVWDLHVQREQLTSWRYKPTGRVIWEIIPLPAPEETAEGLCFVDLPEIRRAFPGVWRWTADLRCDGMVVAHLFEGFKTTENGSFRIIFDEKYPVSITATHVA